VVAKLDAQMSSMGQRTVTEDSLVNYRNYFPYFLALALVLLVLEFFIPERKGAIGRWPWAAGSRQTATAGKEWNKLAVLLIMLIPVASFAQADKMIIKKGNEAYAKKDFASAVASYKKAIEKDPADAVAQYNLGNALYKSNKAEDALGAYENALAGSRTAEDKSRSFYNKGVVLQNNKKLPECIDAYKNALKLNPDDEDARQNLQKALQQQKQEQQKEKKDKQQKKPKEDQQDKQKQKPKDEEKNDQPKPQPSRITKQDAEEKLKALLQQEKNLQDKLKKINVASPNKPEKDW
jgi:Ca-activated chloride channel family protein